MKAFSIVCCLLILAGLSSCDEKNLAGLNVTGKVGEILVVCDDAIWQAPLTNEMDTALTQYIMPYWPDVPTFELEMDYKRCMILLILQSGIVSESILGKNRAPM